MKKTCCACTARRMFSVMMNKRAILNNIKRDFCFLILYVEMKGKNSLFLLMQFSPIHNFTDVYKNVVCLFDVITPSSVVKRKS